LLAASPYGYYLLKQQGDLDFLIGGTGDPLQNPLLLLAPILLALSGSLLFIRWEDVLRVYALVGAALAVVAVGMIRPLRRIRMFEAIKLGEAQSL